MPHVGLPNIMCDAIIMLTISNTVLSTLHSSVHDDIQAKFDTWSSETHCLDLAPVIIYQSVSACILYHHIGAYKQLCQLTFDVFMNFLQLWLSFIPSMVPGLRLVLGLRFHPLPGHI